MQCRAQSKRSGEQCKKDAIVGKPVCHMHGGKTPRGAHNPNFRHGKYSKSLISELGENYTESRGDPILISLREEIALAEAHLHQILQEGESGIRWADAKDAFKQLRSALRDGEPADVQEALENMQWVINQATRDWAHRREVFAAIEKLRRLKDSEHKHMVDERYVMSREEFDAAIIAVFQLLHRHISDASVWTAIGEEWRSIHQASQHSFPSPN